MVLGNPVKRWVALVLSTAAGYGMVDEAGRPRGLGHGGCLATTEAMELGQNVDSMLLLFDAVWPVCRYSDSHSVQIIPFSFLPRGSNLSVASSTTEDSKQHSSSHS